MKKLYNSMERMETNNRDILYVFDSNNKVTGKIDFTMKKICGNIFKNFKKTGNKF